MAEEKRKRILSGIQPTGTPTLGNYIGAVRNWALLQSDYDCLYMVADLHSLTVRQNPAELRRRTRELSALLLAVGIANPFLDRAPLLRLGSVTLTGGVVSMLTLMCKGVFALQASYLLMATTKLEALCAALRRLHVPSLLVSLLLLTYRYISVLLEQAALLSDAYALRAPEQRGVHFRAWGSFLGQLLLRSMDRASALYQAMRLRGYTGEFPYAASAPFQLRDGLFLLGAGALLILARCYDLPVCLGRLLVGL